MKLKTPILLAGLVASTGASAQSLLMDSSRLQKQLETRRLEEPLPNTTTPTAAPARPGPAFETGEVRVAVKGFRITGATQIPEAVLQKALDPFTLRILNFGQLQKAADTLTDIYRSEGFIASRAFLPQQTLSSAGDPSEIEIVILEGRYGRIRLENASQVPDKVILDHLNLKPGEPIHLNKIERNLLLIEDLPGVHVVSSVFTPGELVGETEYILAVESDARLSGNVTADNYGVRTTGTNRVGLEAVFRNPSGNADQINASVVTSGNDLTTGRLAYSLGLGHHGLRGSVSVARTSYRLGEEFAPLGATGTADYISVGLTYPVVRERTFNIALGAGLDFKRLHDKLNGEELSGKRTRLTTLSISGDQIGRLTTHGATAWSVSTSHGTLSINNEGARLTDSLGPNTAGGFGRSNFYLIHEQALSEPRFGVSLQLSACGQYAPDNLDSSEKMALGGPYGVRALPQGEAAADRATLVSLELKKRWTWISGLNITHSVFFDAGRATLSAKPWNDDNNHRTARGYGVGVNLDYKARYFLNGAIAWPSGQGSVDPVEQNRKPRLWVLIGSNY
jgi:hemolysin activation/secretion protein